MSGSPNWATTEPSTNSTSEWTIDSGWINTSILSTGTSNSHRASITSSALFIIVAESIVIFGPIRQTGCDSACSRVTCSRSWGEAPRNGPPEPVSRILRISDDLPDCIAWNTAECSLSTGSSRLPFSLAIRVSSSPATTSGSLLAIARRLPHRAAARTDGKPAAPTTAVRTVSTPSDFAISTRLSDPTRILASHPSISERNRSA